jgi:hypothetical protein
MKDKKYLTSEQKKKLARLKIKKLFKYKEHLALRRKAASSYDAAIVTYLEQAKLESKFKEVFKIALRGIKDHIESEVMNEIMKRFENELQNLRSQGKLYKAEYMSLSSNNLNIQRLNKLGEKGWKYVIDLEGKFVFMREHRAQEN